MADVPSGATPEQADAVGTINQNLAALGLPTSLASWAWGEIQRGVPTAQVMLDMEQTPEFTARFPAIGQLRQQAAAGKVVHVPTPGEYVAAEKTYGDLAHQAGLPDGFLTRDETNKLVLGQVSPGEYNDRIQGAKTALYSTPPAVRAAMNQYYGLDTGDLVALWMDPGKATPLIQQKVLSSQIGGEAARSGWGSLTKAEAEAMQGAGVTQSQAAQGFAQLGQLSPLFSQTVSEAETGGGATRAQGIGFVEGEGADTAAIARAKAAREAAFGGGGGAAGLGGKQSGLSTAGQ